MTFEWRLVVVLLAVAGVASAAGTAIALRLLDRPAIGGAAARAEVWRRRRLIPAVSALMASGIVLVSYLTFEPRGPEDVGWVLPGLAATVVGLLAASAVRAGRTVLATRRAIAAWMRSATPIALPEILIPAFAIDSGFPIVAVIGAFRPRLVVARSVLDACSGDELRAVLAHEQQHIDRRDNWTRTVMALLPDPLGWLPGGRRALDAWRDATEEAADAASTRLGAAGPLHLAQALIRVARLAPAADDVSQVPASTLYRGEGLNRRIERLVAPPSRVDTVSTPPRRWAPRWWMAAGVCLIGLRAVQWTLEAAVTYLP